jgi:hypothetical protein
MDMTRWEPDEKSDIFRGSSTRRRWRDAGMNLDLTDDETAALVQLLRRANRG